MRRVAVIGASCSAKTTLARELAARLDLPHVQLDALDHGPGWTEATAEERQAPVEAALAQHADGWVVDGNYERQIGDLVVGKADTVIWLDLPLALILWGLTRRTAGRVVRRTELWNGNRETLRNALLARESLFVWTIGSHGRHRRHQPGRLARIDADAVHLRSPGEVVRWLASMPNRVDGARPAS
jgi:adenylate kinase family enzyme